MLGPIIVFVDFVVPAASVIAPISDDTDAVAASVVGDAVAAPVVGDAIAAPVVGGAVAAPAAPSSTRPATPDVADGDAGSGGPCGGRCSCCW